MSSWLTACAQFAFTTGVESSWLSALRVFDRGGDAPYVGSFDDLEVRLSNEVEGLVQRISADLASEVDDAQARMFAERFGSVHRLLSQDPTPQARLLAVGLVCRVTQILDEPGKSRALRVRAAVDYFYSRAALHHHLRQVADPPELTALTREIGWRKVAAGVDWAPLQGLTKWGPQHICVLRCQPGAVRLSMLDAYERWGPEHDFAAATVAQGAVAAVSGGFFLYSEPDIAPWCRRHDPVGLLVQDGRVTHPAVFRRASLLQDSSLVNSIETVGMTDMQVRIGDGPWGAPRQYMTRSQGRRCRGVAVVGGRVVAVGDDVDVPLAGVVLRDRWTEEARVGDPVSWRMASVWSAVSGGPMLLERGEVGYSLIDEDFCGSAPPQTFVGDETGDQNLLPRMAAGTTASGELIFAAVDGRHFDRALGLTLSAMGRLMQALDCETAMNLDGGSSKRMVVRGRVVDLASTGIQATGQRSAPARPVHTAVLVHPT